MALKLGGATPAEVNKAKSIYTDQVRILQNENGSFRFPGKERKQLKHAPYASERWLRGGNIKPTQFLGYGLGWSESMITAHALYNLSYYKNYLPAFNSFKN